MSVRTFRLTSKRSLEECPRDHALDGDQQSVCWIDIHQTPTKAMAELLHSIEMHPLAVEACLDGTPAARLSAFGDALFMGLPIHSAWDSPRRSHLLVVCLPGMLVTIHEAEIPALTHVFDQYTGGMRFHGDSTSAILYQIIDHIIDENLAFTLQTRDAINRVDELLDDESSDELTEQVRPLKRQLARLSAAFEDQLYCIGSLQTIESESFHVEGLQDYFRDAVSLLDHASRVITRQVGHLNAIQQEYQLKLQTKTNDRLRLLTIVSTIFIPLTLITGIYGMNFEYMPDLAWRYAYFSTLGLMVILAFAMLYGFYRAGWFR